jgi:hypothetical protein
MPLLVAGKGRSADLGEDIRRAAARLRLAQPYSPADSALSLKDAPDERAFLERFCRLVRLHHGVRTADFDIPARRGRAAVAIKRALWRLLRYQHDRIAFQQNAMNELLVEALEMQQALQRRETTELRDRLARVERELRQRGENA